MSIVLDFLQDIINLLTLQSKMGSGEPKTVLDSKAAYQWFLDESNNKKSTRVQVDREPNFLPGKIYVFKYNAKGKTTLDYWDKHPIVLCLGMIQANKGKLMIGLNISWYPPVARKYIIEKIRQLYKSSYEKNMKAKSFNAKEQGPVYLDLYQLKVALDQFGLSFALRQYIPSRVISPKVCVCYEDWDKAIRLDQPRIFPELAINAPGTSLNSIYEDYKKYVIYQKTNVSEVKISREKSKSSNKFKFVK
jgi:hypothetical protein